MSLIKLCYLTRKQCSVKWEAVLSRNCNALKKKSVSGVCWFFFFFN